MGDWATVHFKTFTGIEEPTMVASSHFADGGHGPK